MTHVRLYQRAKSAAQSGPGGSQGEWILEYEPSAPRFADPLTGWTATRDANSQVSLRFETRKQALDYARRQGLTCPPESGETAARPSQRRVSGSYADNFSHNRREPWTH